MSGCLKARRKPTSSRGVIQRDWIGIVVISSTVHRSSQAVRSAQAISVLRQLEDGFRRTSPTVRSFARYAIRSSNFIQLTSCCGRDTLKGVLRRRFRDRNMLKTARYAHHVKAWQNRFGKQNVLVTFYDDVKADPQEFLDQVTGFIGIRSISLACQRRSKSTSVGRNENASVSGGCGNRGLTSGRGSARGISPSLLQRISNVVAQRAEQSYPDSCGG